MDNVVSVGSAQADFPGPSGNLIAPLTRRIVNMGAGINDTDAVNVSQLRVPITALGGGAGIDPVTGVVSGPTYTLSSGNFTDVGSALLDLDTRVAASGPSYVAQAGAPGAANTAPLTVGANTGGAVVDVANISGDTRTITNVTDGTLSATSSEAVNGSQLFATNENVAQNTTDIANLDTRVTTNETDIANLQTSVGNTNIALEDVAAALGGGSTYDAAIGALTAPTYNVAGGTQNDVGSALLALDDSINNLAATTANAVQYDTDGSGARLNSVTLAGGDPTAPVTVANVAAGELSATSGEAVNGSQLFSTNENVAQNTSDLAALDTRVGTNETSITRLVADTIELDGRVTVNETNIAANTMTIGNLATNISSGTIGLVQQVGGDPDGAILVAANTGGDIVNVAGTAGTRRISGVSRGSVSATSTDAVNGSQLYELQSRVDGLDTGMASLNQRIDSLNFNLRDLRDDLDGGLAGVAALSTIPQSVNPGRWVIGMGSGYRNGNAAVAFGASFRSADDYGTVNMRAAYDGSFTVAVGGGIEF